MQGKTINGYTLQHQLGVGGMAEVWYAENAIEKPAAVKLLLPKFCQDEAIVARFQNEAKVMVKLDHPNIRQVYDYGSIEGRPCIVMEYLEGDDLKALMKKGRRFTDAELRKWWNQIADALNYTHAKGVVHRDIKPSNIFLDAKGNIKLLDFGIAKIKESISMTQTGATMGTLLYMSPEQVDDAKHIGPQSDVYSLAVTFVHLLTGKAPYDSTTSSDYAIRKGIVEIPLDLTGVPANWRNFLAPYLEKDPNKRPALRPFEAVPLSKKPESSTVPPTENEKSPSSSDDEGTIVAGSASKTAELDDSTLAPQTHHSKQSVSQSTPEPKDKPKSKKGLWIGLGAAAVAVIALVIILVRPKSDTSSSGDNITTPTEEQIFQECQTVGDYRAFMDKYGPDATHYAEAKAFVEQYEDCADSLNRVQAEAEALEEVEAYKRCTTVAGCDSYLKAYPQGRYVVEVRNKKSELERNAPKENTYNGHEYVDLGLPSGTLWATCNVGASKPEGCGNYYAWGETQTKTTYTWENYKYDNGDKDNSKLTKYCNKPQQGDNGFTDNLTVMLSEDDAATANWGKGWCTPSLEQWQELLQNTTNKWTAQSGVNGRLFTAKNGKTFFLPAVGFRFEGNRYNSSNGYYWSNSLPTGFPGDAWYLDFDSGGCQIREQFRHAGFLIRPVRKK